MTDRKVSSWVLSAVAASLLAGSIPSALAMPEMAWDGANSPARLEPNFSPYFDETGVSVPLESKVPVAMMPYVDTYWPSNRGGIAYRWNQHDSVFSWRSPYLVAMIVRYRAQLPPASDRAAMDDAALEMVREMEQMSASERVQIYNDAFAVFKIHSPSRDEATRMSRDQLAQLSPSEKYDLVRGKYDYPLTHEVLGGKGGLFSFGSKKVGPFRAYWEGICHGWAPASVNHAEPLPNDVTNPDGIVVPFGSADVKAIIDYMYATRDMHARQMGLRCDTDLTKNPNAGGMRCYGVNPGAFHIAMMNYIGIRHQPFVADVAHGKEIWNNPIYAYSSTIDNRSGPTSSSAPGTTHRVHVSTKIRYPSDDERLGPQWEPTVGREEMLIPDTETPLDASKYANVYRYEQQTYEYWLDLDAANRIVGGEWTSKERTDYVWMKNKMQFTDDFSALNYIYKPAYKR